MEQLAYQLFQDQKKALDLIAERKAVSGFELALDRVFGTNSQPKRPVRVGKHNFVSSRREKNRASFLPAKWQEELDRTRGAWPGCENWWAGYPLILWVELRLDGDGTTGYLRLNAEIGPISDQRARKGIIEAIKAAASANDLERIHFEAGATDKGRLYSRFLRKNSITVSAVHDANEVERKFMQLIADFGPEFELVGSVIPQFLSFGDAPSR